MAQAATKKVTALHKGYRTRHQIRVVTAASLFDGHDASINIIRRILQASGSEVIHLGHNRAVDEIVTAAIQEDVQAIAVSSYQGGHIEFFKYMLDLLRERGAGDIRVFGGGGGVIVPAEIRELEEYGVARVYSPDDGQRMGLQGIIDDMLAQSDFDPAAQVPPDVEALGKGDWRALARFITALENGVLAKDQAQEIARRAGKLSASVPVIGITGTGGAGKSSLTDELVLRFRLDHDDALKIAIIAVDPSRRKTGGALLGDRIRMNAIHVPTIYMRSLATRQAQRELPKTLPEIIAATKVAGFDLVIIETPGIGQGDAGIVPFADVSLYVMTPEFGAASQLEKIDMLDFADLVAINKFDRRGAQDALRDVRKQIQRNHQAFSAPIEEMPVYGTVAAHFNDDGVTALYQGLTARMREKGVWERHGRLPAAGVKVSTGETVIVPPARQRYLAEIAETVRGYKETVGEQVRLARERQQLVESQRMLGESGQDASALAKLIAEREQAMDPRARKLIDIWPKIKDSYTGEEYVVKIRDREIRTPLQYTTLSGTQIPKVGLPRYEDHGELLRWLLLENLPGKIGRAHV